jgi:predicted GTPase
MTDVVVIKEIDTAGLQDISAVRRNVLSLNPSVMVVDAASPIAVEDPKAIRGKKVLVVEDGPTLTHGGTSFGAGTVAAQRFGAAETVDPRPYAVGSIKDIYDKYPMIGPLLPAMGYSSQQVKELEQTMNATPCYLVVVATPIDLRRVARIDRPCDRVRYELQEIGQPTLEDPVKAMFA